MTYRMWSIGLALFLAGCESGRHTTAIDPKCLVYTTDNNHKITTWVNGEPVLVCDGVYNGYNKPFWPFLRKGRNEVHFTAQRLPERVGSTTVKLILGSVFAPEKIVELARWDISGDSGESPRWTVVASVGFRPSLDGFDTMPPVDERARREIQQFLAKLKDALERKQPEEIGLALGDWEDVLREFGLKCSFARDVFSVENYVVTVSPFEELLFCHGNKTIVAYRHDGKGICHAGRDPAAPRETGKLYWSLSFDALYFVREQGVLKPLWPKRQ